MKTTINREEVVNYENAKEDLGRVYTYEEVYQETLKYFKGDELATNVWINKYALKDSNGRFYEKSPDDMHRRLAREIARIERKYPNPLSEEQIYELIKEFKYIIPQGGSMAGIGNKFQIVSLSNCFVIGIEGAADSYGGILKIDEEQVQLMKRRGGVGHDLSHIRPAGSPVMNSALTSTGIVPFMERYSNSTREVAQDGRRGALMLTISIKHPDAEKFIDAKLEKGKITGANISVKIDDEFMYAALNKKTYIQQFPIDSPTPKIKKEIDAYSLWKKIIHNAWKSAEPGVLFWDTIIRESVADCYANFGFKTVSTNPCGEIPLCPYDSCRLLAINLYSYVLNPFTKDAYFDFELFKKHVHYAQRIMDDIVDLELEKIDLILKKIDSDPEPEYVKETEKQLWQKIKQKAIQGRRVGIGITGEGDMLAALNLRYGSDEAINFSVKVHKTLAIEAYRASVNLAKERGCFPIFDHKLEENNPFINRIKEEDPALYEEMKLYGRRNISLLTIAPTGSTSIMTQTSSGIEPVFRLFYKRRRKVNPNDKSVKITFIDEVGDAWEEYNVFHHKFIEWLKINNYNIEEIKNLDEKTLNEIITKSPYYKSTANEIDWVAKVRMQGEIQKWVDHSISVTVNLPEDVTEEVVEKVYETGWRSGCKGITVYREGSRSGVLISSSKETTNNSEKKDTKTKSAIGEVKKRPKKLEADVVRFQNKNEKWIAFIGLLDGKPYEIFTGRDDEDTFIIPKWVKKGYIVKVKTNDGTKRYDFKYKDKDGYTHTFSGLSRIFDKEFWNYAKLISGVLRYGMPIVDVINLVSSLTLDNENINSWKNGVVRALKRYVPDGTKPSKKELCPNCNNDSLIYKEGCLTCLCCGYSKCE